MQLRKQLSTFINSNTRSNQATAAKKTNDIENLMKLQPERRSRSTRLPKSSNTISYKITQQKIYQGELSDYSKNEQINRNNSITVRGCNNIKIQPMQSASKQYKIHNYSKYPNQKDMQISDKLLQIQKNIRQIESLINKANVSTGRANESTSYAQPSEIEKEIIYNNLVKSSSNPNLKTYKSLFNHVKSDFNSVLAFNPNHEVHKKFANYMRLSSLPKKNQNKISSFYCNKSYDNVLTIINEEDEVAKETKILEDVSVDSNDCNLIPINDEFNIFNETRTIKNLNNSHSLLFIKENIRYQGEKTKSNATTKDKTNYRGSVDKFTAKGISNVKLSVSPRISNG